MSQEPVHLPSSILRKDAAPPVPPPRAATRDPVFTIGRRTNNELILFDEDAAESWIVYPPRSEYEFLRTRRRSAGSTIVEHHPWSATLAAVDHVIDAREGCQEHGLKCRAQQAIAAAVQRGYDPFA